VLEAHEAGDLLSVLIGRSARAHEFGSRKFTQEDSVFRRLLIRRAGPVGLALTAYDIWRRIPPKQRAKLVDVARKHGPRVAARAAQARQRRRPPRRG
jgi:hypothetical protein